MAFTVHKFKGKVTSTLDQAI